MNLIKTNPGHITPQKWKETIRQIYCNAQQWWLFLDSHLFIIVILFIIIIIIIIFNNCNYYQHILNAVYDRHTTAM